MWSPKLTLLLRLCVVWRPKGHDGYMYAPRSGWQIRLLLFQISLEDVEVVCPDNLYSSGEVHRRLLWVSSLGLAPHRLLVVDVGVVSTDRESSRHLLLKAANRISRRNEDTT
ncbi:hypothetical protein YC2023_065867 [Brassica napus]